MHRPRFLDRMAAELGDAYAFCSRLTAGRHSFQPAHVEPKWARDRSAEVKHIRLAVSLDFAARTVSGTATHLVAAILDDLRQLEFDQVDLTISGVRVDGREVAFETRDDKLRFDLPAPLQAGGQAEIAIDYSARPRRGLYFVGPDEAYPDKPVEAWSQGEDEDSRFWFPCYDYPNNKSTSEVIVTVPRQFFALSNGALAGTVANPDGTRTFHWRQEVPHSAYLLTLVAGDFVEIADRHGDLPVLYYVHPGREEDARRAFGNTPRMIEFFERKIGVKYPYAKYAQIAVNDFIFGGMENISATTQTADTLHDARAHLDFSSDPLVAHELAHQWWGNLVTCRDWAHAWLNEGFATYFEALWSEENLGADEFAWNLKQDRTNYLSEASHRYRRPIVCNRYRAPIELFDRHLYEKGSLVLHMLRRLLGDRLFFKSLNLYATRHRGGNVITQDLQKAFEDATGRNLDYFFDQWVYKEGHPEIEVSSSFDDRLKVAAITIKQTQRVSETTPLFRLAAEIALMDQDGRETRYPVEITRAEQTFHFPCAAAPKAVRIDPGADLLMTLRHKRSREALELLLCHAPEAIGRAQAAADLGAEASPAAVGALRNALMTDPFWGVQAAAAQALAQIRTPEALAALVESLTVRHPKARRAVVQALGAFRGQGQAAEALRQVLQGGDDSYFVEAEAALALGKTRDPDAFEHLRQALERDSYLEVIRAHALSGLAELRDARGIELARQRAAYGRPTRERLAAIGTLGRLGRAHQAHREEVLDYLTALAHDPSFSVRMRLPGALEDLGEARALATLRQLADSALDGRLKRRAEEAMEGIRDGHAHSDETNRLRDEVDRLREESRKLLERLERMENVARAREAAKSSA
jgi:aminopeptidase N